LLHVNELLTDVTEYQVEPYNVSYLVQPTGKAALYFIEMIKGVEDLRKFI